MYLYHFIVMWIVRPYWTFGKAEMNGKVLGKERTLRYK
jgi:hypothetical protein